MAENSKKALQKQFYIEINIKPLILPKLTKHMNQFNFFGLK